MAAPSKLATAAGSGTASGRGMTPVESCECVVWQAEAVFDEVDEVEIFGVGPRGPLSVGHGRTLQRVRPLGNSKNQIVQEAPSQKRSSAARSCASTVDRTVWSFATISS